MNAPQFTNIQACVFDAYGTLLDFNSAVMNCADEIGDDAARLSEIWRQKQLQYTWLRSLMGTHADFWQVTGEALDFSLDAIGLENPELRESSNSEKVIKLAESENSSETSPPLPPLQETGSLPSFPPTQRPRRSRG